MRLVKLIIAVPNFCYEAEFVTIIEGRLINKTTEVVNCQSTELRRLIENGYSASCDGSPIPAHEYDRLVREASFVRRVIIRKAAK